MHDPINDIPNTPMQQLLDEEALLQNAGHRDKAAIIRQEIRDLRGSRAPTCFGHDDCSTLRLIQCPWRFDCGV